MKTLSYVAHGTYGMPEEKGRKLYRILYIKLYITIGWRGTIIGASKNSLGACYAHKRD